MPQTVALFTPPAEDSESIGAMQRTTNQRGVFYYGTQIDFHAERWGRPTLLDTIITTEMRYAFNVARMIFDRLFYGILFNPNIPFAVKLTHLFLFWHYFIAPFALVLLILLPGLSPISAFAYLKPLFFWVFTGTLLMEAINVNNFVRHWRQSGNFFAAVIFTLIDVVKALPMFVFLIPFFFRGLWLASNEIFEFIRTVKEAFLVVWNESQRFDELMIFKRFGPKGIPLNS